VYTDLLLFLTLPKSQALPRAQFFAKSQIKNSRQRKTPNKEASLTRAIKKYSAQITLPRGKRLALDKEILKNCFLPLVFFYFQHRLIQDLYKN
jgi:hypothetical protein